MKKPLLILLFVPIVSFGQNSIEDNIDYFKELVTDPAYGGSPKSFFKGYWIDTSGILKLAETVFGTPIFNSGPHTKEYFCSDCNSVEGEFGHYNPIFLDELIKTIKSMSPELKTALKPLYFRKFETPLKKLIDNQIEDHFTSDCNRWLLERIKNKDDIKEILHEIFFGIENNCDEISGETLFWIRRDYDGTSKQFLKLFNLIMKEFDPEGFSASSKLNFNTSIGQDYYVSAKGGLNVREAPNSKAKRVSTLSYGTFISVKSKTAIKLTINDTDKETGIKKQIEGEWVEIVSENSISGYVFDGFLVPFKPHPWTIFTTVSKAILNINGINLKSKEIAITYDHLTKYYKNLKVGEIVQLVPLENGLPNLEFRVTSIEKVIYPDPDLAHECCDEYKVEAIILETLPKKYIDFNKDYINSLIVHPPVKDAKFIDIPRIKASQFGDTYRSWLDFDNDGNPDVRQQSDDGSFVTEILINGNWVELILLVPM